MLKRAYCILTPQSDQARVLLRLLSKYIEDVEIIAIAMSSKELPRSLGDYASVAEYEGHESTACFVPTGAVSTRFLLEKGDVIIGSIILTKTALRVFDKPWIIAHAAAIGIPVPATWRRLEDVKEFPLFYKQRIEQGGGVRGIAQCAADIPASNREQLIFQEFIDNQGTYGVGFLADKGRLLAVHTHFERESIPKEGGSAVIIERFNDDRLLKHTKRLIMSLNYSGWGLAEFKYCPRRDDYVFMEINAKFWASCEFAFVNEPAFLKFLFGIESKEQPINRMIFIDRAFQRGLWFMLKNITILGRGSALRFYQFKSRLIIEACIPKSVRVALKSLIKRGLAT